MPVVVRQAESSELLELALIENIQRADLNAVEEAMAYRRLVEEYNLTQEEVAKRVGKNRATVANALRLLQLESEIRRSLVAGKSAKGMPRAAGSGGQGPREAWREVEAQGFLRIPAWCAGRSRKRRPPPLRGADTRRDSAYSDIESAAPCLSTRVKVDPHKKGAKIFIACYPRRSSRTC